jgi:hypothetical protein
VSVTELPEKVSTQLTKRICFEKSGHVSTFLKVPSDGLDSVFISDGGNGCNFRDSTPVRRSLISSSYKTSAMSEPAENV